MISVALLDQLNADMKEAMKAKEKDRLSVIRMLKASLQNESIHLGVGDSAADLILQPFDWHDHGYFILL